MRSAGVEVSRSTKLEWTPFKSAFLEVHTAASTKFLKLVGKVESTDR